jgi:hypothetical protein
MTNGATVNFTSPKGIRLKARQILRVGIKLLTESREKDQEKKKTDGDRYKRGTHDRGPFA